MHPMLNTAIRAARRSGQTIVRALDRMDSIEVLEKSHNNFVTSVDKASEESIIESISTAHPDHCFLTEESGKITNRDTDALWIIDPLDGTTNFIHGVPHYSVSIALKLNDRMEHAVIFNPITQNLFTASRGRGAQLNGRRIRVSGRTKLDGTLLATSMPKDKNLTAAYLKRMEKLHGTCAGMRRTGSTTLDLAYVAAGFLDGYWNQTSQPWDMAAGSLLIREAGGMVTDVNGTDAYLDNGNIVAGNPKIIKQLLGLLRD